MIVSLKNKSNILILQHTSERKHPLNSARIAELSFQNCRILTGENFSNNTVLNKTIEKNCCYLLFPSNDAQDISTLASTKKHTQNDIRPTLILIDGSWRKAKKVFYLSKNLHQIPTLSLPLNYKSRYRIRKQPSSHCLSTLEALTYSLNILEDQDFSAVFEAFDYMIDFQIDKMSEPIYSKNYQKI